MSSRLTEWRALAGRIQALEGAVEMWSNFHSSQNSGELSKALWPRLRSTYEALSDFANDADSWLSDGVKKALEDTRLADLFAHGDPSLTMRDIQTAEAAMRLRVIRTEVEYHLASGEEDLRSATERSLLHLNWSIMSNSNTQNEWEDAFTNRSEPALEALGATHLLLNGIFAFKAHSPRARTDLVLGEDVGDRSEKVATGLVLTEWKKLTGDRVTEEQVNEAAAAARQQASIYKEGLLQGIELRTVRYIILVTRKQVKVPDDVSGESYTFRHRNIAVNPERPSAAAIRLAQS